MSFNKILPHVIAITFFFVITCLFFKPIVIDGQQLKQQDISMGAGMGRQITLANETNESPAMWNISAFGGMPAYVTGAAHKDANIKGFIQRLSYLFIKSPANLMFLAMLFTYIMLIAYKVNPYVAIFGAIAFSMTTFNILSLTAGHNAKIRALCYVPLILAGIQHLKRDNKNIGIIILLGAFSWMIFTGHYQILYYTALMFGFYFIVDFVNALIQQETKKYFIRVAIVIGCAILGLFSNLGKIWTISEFSEYSIRGKYLLESKSEERPESGLDSKYAFQYQEGIKESMTLFIPNFNGGGASANLEDKIEDSHTLKFLRTSGMQQANKIAQYVLSGAYYGPQGSTAWPIYVGAITCFLFLISFLILSIPQRIWIGFSFLFFLLVSWGLHADTFAKFMFDYFPMYNKFRAVSMSLGMVSFVMAVAAALTLNKIISSPLNKPMLYKIGSVGAFLTIICFYIVLSPNSTGAISNPKDEQIIASRIFQSTPEKINATNPNLLPGLTMSLTKDRIELLSSDTYRALIFIILAFAVLALFYFNVINDPRILGGILALLCLIDLWGVNKRYFSEYSYEEPKDFVFRPTQADKEIKNDPANKKDIHFRVLNSGGPYNESETSYHHRSLGGYSPAKLRRTQDIYEYYIEPVLYGSKDSNTLKGFTNYLSIADCKYILINNRAQKIVQPGKLGAAWFISDIVKVNSNNEEIVQLGKINPKIQAIVHNEFNTPITKFEVGSAEVKLKTYSNNKIEYSTSNQNEGFIVFSEIYYPIGWTLFVDGKPTKLIRANYNFRGAQIPAGNHKLEMIFAPNSYIIGSNVSLITTILVIITMLFLGYLEYKKQAIVKA